MVQKGAGSQVRVRNTVTYTYTVYCPILLFCFPCSTVIYRNSFHFYWKARCLWYYFSDYFVRIAKAREWPVQERWARYFPLLEKLSPGKTGFFPKLFHFNLCSGSRSGGSVIYWPPGSVSVIWITNPDQNPYYLSKLQKTFRKVHCFIIFNDIPPVWQHFFLGRKNVHLGSESGRISNYLAFWIRNTGLRIRTRIKCLRIRNTDLNSLLIFSIMSCKKQK